MKKVYFLTLLLFSPLALSADIVTGWSTELSIVKIHKEDARTLFELSSTSQGCGHTSLWVLPTVDNVSHNTKYSLLLSLAMAGKRLKLRCLNSSVADIEAIM